MADRLVAGPFRDDVDRNGDWREGTGKAAAEEEAERLRQMLRDMNVTGYGGVRVKRMRPHVYGVFGGPHERKHLK